MKRMLQESLLRGAINTATQVPDVRFETIYNVLLNHSSLRKLKPFNCLRFTDSIPQTESLFRYWLEVTSGTGDMTTRGKRIARAVARLARDYGHLLPVEFNTEESLTVAFRVFFLPRDCYVELSGAARLALNSILPIMNSLIFIDLLFTQDYILGISCEEYIKTILEGCGQQQRTVMELINEQLQTASTTEVTC